jgi:hypothetical protein
MGVILAICIYFFYSINHVQVELSSEQITIRGDIYGRTIPLNELVVDKARKINLNETKEYQPRIRTNGIGLPGYLSGWFRLKNGGKALLFVTDWKAVIYLPTTKNYSLLMTIQDPDRFLEFLQDIDYNN